MKLENQCCSLQSAKRLKELGIEQKVLYQWKQNNVQTVIIDTPMAMWIEEYVPIVGNKFFAAFTVAELGCMLPDYVYSTKSDNHFSLGIYWPVNFDGSSFKWEEWKTEAQARAAMLIYLLENSLISSKEINDRLCQE